MALMTLKLWELVGLALPLIVILLGAGRRDLASRRG